MKRLIATLLCAAMLLALASGCAGRTDEPAANESLANLEPLQEGPAENGANEQNGADDLGAQPHENGDTTEPECFFIDFYGAFNAFEPDTVMMTTAGGHTVTWEEMFFGFYGAIMNVLEHLGEITDWYETFGDDTTLSDIVFDMAETDVLRRKAIEHGAALYGVTLTQEELDFIQTRIDVSIDDHGSLENLMRGLWYESGVRTISMITHLLEIELLTTRIFHVFFGEDGILSTYDGIDEFFAANDYGFMMAKHILISFDDNPENARERADEIWVRLNEYTGSDIEALFDELMHQYSEDPGLEHFPQGYLFQFPEMVPEFSQGTYELEIGQFSEPIETIHGFHIILRLPNNFSEVTTSTLFSSMLMFWFDTLQPVFSPEFYSIVLSEMFLPC